MLRNGLGPLGGRDGCLCGSFGSLPLQSGDFDHFASKLTAEFRHVDVVALPADQVHHVQGDHHRDANLHQLCGEIEVSLQVGGIDDIQDDIRAFLNQIITRNHLFQCIGGKGVDARKVGHDNVLVILQAAFLLLNRNTRPVADELIRAGQRIEQGRLPAVWIAREGNADLFFHLVSPLLLSDSASALRRLSS